MCGGGATYKASKSSVSTLRASSNHALASEAMPACTPKGIVWVPEIHRWWSQRCRDRRVPVAGHEDLIVFRVSYRLARLIIDLLVLRGRRVRSKDAEILVLRHQLAVLHRQVPHSRFDDTDRTLMSALAPWSTVHAGRRSS
jgi:hypothetical protein